MKFLQFVANSPEIVNANETLNKYLSSNITYNYAGITQVLDRSIIKDWIIIDGNFQVTLDETKVRKYVYNLASNYNKSLGTTIPVNGGYDGNNHSWIINSEKKQRH